MIEYKLLNLLLCSYNLYIKQPNKKLFCCRTQILNEENRKVVERSMEPEKIFTDSFVTENIDGRKVNITRKVSSRKVEKIIYLDQVMFVQNKDRMLLVLLILD